MKKNKPRGQIKRVKGLREENTEGEKEIEGEREVSLIQFVFLCMFYMMGVSKSSILRANEGWRSGID